MATRPVSLSKAVALINTNPNDIINSHHGLSQYLKDLRTVLRSTVEELMIRREQPIFPILPVKLYNFNYHKEETTHWFFDKDENDYLFITITFDPRKFPQIVVATHIQQQKYIEQAIASSIEEEVIRLFYGVLEEQKNGNLHFHFVVQKYNCKDNINQLIEFFKPLFTDVKTNKYCIDVKPVTDLKNLFEDYLKKKPLGYIHNLPQDLALDLDLNPLNEKPLEIFKSFSLEKTI